MLVIYSKPSVSEEDHQWIERIRRLHDPQALMIPAHFTFVFPFTGPSAEQVTSHAAKVSEANAPIRFRLTETAIVKDTFGPDTHLFLLPTDGASRMRELHAGLYTGALAPHLNSGITFLPHVTVGAFDQEADAARVVDELGNFDIAGVLSNICVAEFDGNEVVDLCILPFRG